MERRIWWDLVAIVAALVTAALSGFELPLGVDDWGAVAAAGALLVVHFAAGRRCVGAEVPWQPAVAAAYAVVIAVGCAFNPSFAFAQSFVYPYLWFTAPSQRIAIIENVMIAGALVVGYTIGGGLPMLAIGLGAAALSLAFSLALGLWITRIAVLSEERGRLLAELQQAQGQLAVMHREAGIEAERSRLARELHDTIAQSLTGLVMVAQRARRSIAGDRAEAAGEDVALIETMAREALVETRALVAGSSPAPAGASLAEALERLGRSFAHETGLEISVDVDDGPLGRELEVVLLRAAQEGLANVRKHADASRASITVRRTAGAVELEVGDDGRGPGADAGSRAGGGFGLAGLEDRVGLVGGTVRFGGGEGGGALLRVTVPGRADAPAEAGSVGAPAEAGSVGAAGAAGACSDVAPDPAAPEETA